MRTPIAATLAVLAVACGHSSAPSIPFGSLDDAALARMYSLCKPASVSGDAAANGRQSVPRTYRGTVTAPAMRICDHLEGDANSYISLVRDENGGQVVSMEIYLRSTTGGVTPEAVDRIFTVAVDPWIKVVAPSALHDLIKKAFANPNASRVKSPGELRGPGWLIDARIDHSDVATTFSFHADLLDP